MGSTHARHVARSENSKKFRKVLCFLTWQKAKQLRPANRMRHPRAARVGRRRLSFPPCAFSFGTLLLCAWPHQKPSQMFTSCLPAACVFYAFFLLFCFCFSIIVVLASFITPYFMLVLAFCLLLSFRLWIVVKFFVIINFFSFDAFFGFLFFEGCLRERLWVSLGLVSAMRQNGKVISASASFGASSDSY